jgi:tetratricopeptide (TPR) repeat protein
MKSAKYVLPLLLAIFLLGCIQAAAQQKKAPKDKDKDKNAQYQYEMGSVALNYGLIDEAIRYANIAASLDPRHYGAQSLLGSAYFKKGMYAESAAAYEKAQELRPDLVEVHTNLGVVYLETGAQDKAVAEFEKAVAIDGNATAAFYLARVYFKQKKLDEALDAVQRSITKNGKNAGAYNLKGVILNELKRFAEAKGSFQAGLVLAPNDVNLQLNLGIAYYNNNEPDKARQTLEKVLPQISDPPLKLKVEEYLNAIKNSEKR